MEKVLQDRIVLVTGGNHGIGLETCRQLAEKGANMLLAARDNAKGEAATRELTDAGLSVQFLPMDVTDTESVENARRTVEAKFGRLDILINNAGIFRDPTETASKTDLDDAHAVLETNLWGAWRVTQAFLPLLQKAGKQGRIVFVSSGAGSHGDTQFGLTTSYGGSASYGVSKAALNGLTAKFAIELKESGILVNAVCPGFTATKPGLEAMGARPVADGAASVVWAATLNDDEATGGFWRDGKPLPW